MEETLASQKMSKIDLINILEKISSEIPNRILKLEGFLLKKYQKETFNGIQNTKLCKRCSNIINSEFI